MNPFMQREMFPGQSSNKRVRGVYESKLTKEGQLLCDFCLKDVGGPASAKFANIATTRYKGKSLCVPCMTIIEKELQEHNDRLAALQKQIKETKAKHRAALMLRRAMVRRKQKLKKKK